jgi:hypothetical protein
MNFHIVLFYHAGDGDPSGNAPPLGVGSFMSIIMDEAQIVTEILMK